MMKYCLKLGNSLDKLKEIPDEFCRCCVTSPPYWGLRNYQCEDQLGMEKSPEEYVSNIVEICSEIYRVLTVDGTLWLNIGDSYWGGKGQSGSGDPEQQLERNKSGESLNKSYHHVAGKKKTRPSDGKHPIIKPKDLCGIPWRVAFALQEFGWYLRQDIIWAKRNCMPESMDDRCTRSHEYIFLMTKNKQYYFNNKAIFEEASYDGRKDTKLKGCQKYENGEYLQNQPEQTFHARGHERWPNSVDGIRMRNKRDVWFVNTANYKGNHYAVMPFEIAETCILAGSKEEDWIIDPFSGSGTTGLASLSLKRNYLGIEINSDFLIESRNRIEESHGMFIDEVDIKK